MTACTNTLNRLECPVEGQVLVLYKAKLTREDFTTCIHVQQTTSTQQPSITVPSTQYSTYSSDIINTTEYISNTTTPIYNASSDITDYVTDAYNMTTETVTNLTDNNSALGNTVSSPTTGSNTTEYAEETTSYQQTTPTATNEVMTTDKDATSSESLMMTTMSHVQVSTAGPISSRLTDERVETVRLCPAENILEEINEKCFRKQQCQFHINETVIQNSLCRDAMPYIIIEYICVQGKYRLV